MRYFLSYKDLLLSNSSLLKLENLNAIVECISISPILEIALETHPIPHFHAWVQRNRDALAVRNNQTQRGRIVTQHVPKSVHDALCLGSRVELKNRLSKEPFFSRINEHSSETYMEKLLQIIHSNESYLMSLSPSKKEGPKGEENGIVEDFPEYVKYLFEKFSDGATGKEYLFCALKRIEMLDDLEQKSNATQLLLDTLNDARLAYEAHHHFVPGKRYSCMPGLSERLIDMFLPLLPASSVSQDSWARRYYAAATEGFIAGLLPSEFLQKMFLDAYSHRILAASDAEDVSALKDTVCKLYGIALYHLEYLLVLLKDEQLWGMLEYVQMAVADKQHALHSINAEKFVQEKLSLLSFFQDWSATEQVQLSTKHVVYFYWNEQTMTQLTQYIESNMNNIIQHSHSQRLPLPCQVELLVELVRQKRFSNVTFHSLIKFSISEKIPTLFFALHNSDNAPADKRSFSISSYFREAVTVDFEEAIELYTNQSLQQFISAGDMEPIFLAIAHGKRSTIESHQSIIESVLVESPLVKKDINKFFFSSDSQQQTLLRCAIRRNYLFIVKQLLTVESLDLNCRPSSYRCDDGMVFDYLLERDGALLLATRAGNVDMVQVLLQHPQVQINACGENSETPIMVAVQNGCTEIVKLLLSHPTAAEYRIPNSVFCHAAKHNQVEMMKWLLKHPKKEIIKFHSSPFPLTRNTEIISLVSHALIEEFINEQKIVSLLFTLILGDIKAFDHYIPQLEEVMKRDDTRFDIDAALVTTVAAYPYFEQELYPYKEKTVLWLAVSLGHTELVRVLLLHPGINIYFRYYGEGSLFTIASDVGKEDISTLLHCFEKQLSVLGEIVKTGNVAKYQAWSLQNNVPINAPDCQGYTPLMIAIRNRHADMVSLLLTHPKIDVNLSKPFLSGNALRLAGADNNDCLQILLSQGNALSLSARTQANINDVLRLLEHGAYHVIMEHMQSFLQFLDALRGKYDFAELLRIAAKRNYSPIVDFCLNEKFLDLNKLDGDGRSAFMVACMSGYKEIAEKMLQMQSRIKPNIISKTHDTALMLAMKGQHISILKMLLKFPELDVNLAPDSNNGDCPIHFAVRQQHLEIVPLLLAHPQINVNAINKAGDSALLLATKLNAVDIASILLIHPNISVNIGDIEGNTALMISTQQHHYDLFTLLLSRNDIDLKCCNNKKQSALMVAIQSREVTGKSTVDENFFVKNILEKGDASVLNFLDAAMETALMLAIDRDDVSSVNLLLQHSELDINQRDEHGETALMRACRKGKIKFVEMLLADGLYALSLRINECNAIGETALIIAVSEVSTSATSLRMLQLLLTYPGIITGSLTSTKETALMRACRNGLTDCVHLLCQDAFIISSINQCDQRGENALFIALLQRHTAIFRHLLSLPSIDVNALCNAGQHSYTPLMIAAKNGYEEEVNLLLLHEHIQLNVQNDLQETALMLAVRSNHPNIVGALLRCGNRIDCNLYDASQHTAFMNACRNGREDIVTLFLHQDASAIDVNCMNKNGETALMLAIEFGADNIVEMILQYTHAKGPLLINHTDRNGDTALSIAVSNNRCDIVKRLLSYPLVDVEHANKQKQTVFDLASSPAMKSILKTWKYTHKLMVYLQEKKHSNVLEKVEAMVAKYPDIDINTARDPVSGASALMLAITVQQSEDLVEWLVHRQPLSHELDVNVVDNNGHSALYKAVVGKQKGIVKLLIKYTADRLAVNSRYGPLQQTALHIAVQHGYSKVVERLVKHPAIDLTVEDSTGRTAVQCAQEKNLTDITDIFNKLTL